MRMRSGIWNIAPITDEPITVISRWHIRRTVNTGTYHLVGTSNDGYGRVSSDVVSFIDSQFTTRSGRKYRPNGPPSSPSSDAWYVLGNWEAINEKTEDATTEYFDKIGVKLTDETFL